MAEHKAPGRGKITAQLDRIPKDQVTQPPTPQKTGVETIREKFQDHADSEPYDRVVVVDHDANRVLFSGTPEQFKTLKKALAKE